MNGVEILNQTNVYQMEGEPWIFWLIVGIGFLVGLIFVIVSWCKYGFDADDLWIPFGTMCMGLILGGLCFIMTLHENDELDYVKYQVIVSDEVSLNDFMDKYEILDQEGKIYIVKEKTND